MATLNCPACNKTDVITEACPRCGCDLTRLHTILQAAHRHYAASAQRLIEGEWMLAFQHATQSWCLRHTPAAARLAFLAASANGDTTRAALWHDRAKVLERTIRSD